MRKYTRLALIAAGLTLFASGSEADIINLTSSIDGAQAGTGSSATGSATMTFDDQTNELAWDISWTPLEGDITQAHFHGPAEPGQTAGIQVNWGSISGLVSPSIGQATITATQAADLLAGLYYINIHSTVAPAGEIRGQVLIAIADDDGDGVPNDTDNCPAVANDDQLDDDEDLVGNACDNCTLVANSDQRDTNGDGYGNICDADLDDSGTINFADLAILKLVFFTDDADADFDGNGSVNFADLAIMKTSFFGAPGPSGVAP
jgi:CHRD domain/Thrombospondin type 3 repeat